VRLIVDANRAYTADQAIRVGRGIEDCDIYWFEEPVLAEDLAGYRAVREALSIPIAGGEGEYTRWGFRQMLEAQAVDIIQPDVGLAGGLSECRNIAYLASAYNVRCIPHAWGTCVCLAATLQMLAATPDYPPRLLPEEPMLEVDTTPNPLRDELAVEPIGIEDGYVQVPDIPGIGVEINRGQLARWTISKRETSL
jgi:D-galactarolactone cycloisomerase